MSPQVDLRELAFERSEPKKPVRRPQRAWVSRYAIPGTILAAFAALIGGALRDELTSRKTVTVTPVIVTRAEVQQSGAPLFQAAGWIEPRPTPVNVAAMTEGVVKELRVVGGQSVKAGESVAQLIDVDAKFNLKEAESVMELREAELKGAEADLVAARSRYDKPVHLQAQLAEAQSLEAKTQTELGKLPFLVQAAEIRIEFAKANFEGKRSAGDGVSARVRHQAESDYREVEAELAELKMRKPNLEREASALNTKSAAIAEQLQLLVEELREVKNCEAKVTAAQSSLEQACLKMQRAQLAVERTTVRSPIDGVILQVVAHPGSRVMGLDANSTISSSTVVTMYDPNQLQIRADVRLEDVPLVEIGQPVEITTASSKEPIKGEVLRATSTANIQKNTLEVKVAISSPPPTLRPEMLVSATFIAPQRESPAEDESKEAERLLIPKELVDRSGGQPKVWIVDPQSYARRQSVTLGKASTEALIEVAGGLTLTDKLIVNGREGLQEGEAVLITGESD